MKPVFCRYGVDGKILIKAEYGVFDSAKCEKKCRYKNGCVAYAFENKIEQPPESNNCYLYQGGPYTYGSG